MRVILVNWSLLGRNSYGANEDSLYFYISNRCFFMKLIWLVIIQIQLFNLCSNFFRRTVVTNFNSLTIRTELDIKSEYLFRMCSVVTNLVTSLEIQPIRCATMLLHFGRTRSIYVATRIILFSSTAENSATSGYAAATERSGQSEAWASRNLERARKKPSLFPAVI